VSWGRERAREWGSCEMAWRRERARERGWEDEDTYHSSPRKRTGRWVTGTERKRRNQTGKRVIVLTCSHRHVFVHSILGKRKRRTESKELRNRRERKTGSGFWISVLFQMYLPLYYTNLSKQPLQDTPRNFSYGYRKSIKSTTQLCQDTQIQ